ncbi:MAG: phosphatidylserine decarboxylase [Oceanicoccus sp.]|uniref:archaetidylserine decarboxylase n=1 Tax=Oceanicoccus sp. TaxID=2691044 RepID=UPI0026242C17|nr:archaetidylserine decarboxylase [Oceanicoccus sp.]MCP3907278.1 phosphatidylserine decarboxylase [Oceanicoccus sp.]MDG1772276.1 archaetidylserine decarboxylase [Oceanicoccus sp.]
MNVLFIIFQYIVPQHLLSRAAGMVAECEWPWVKNKFIQWFIRRYNVNMDEAADPEPLNYKNFNAFFTRELMAGARPITIEENSIACPADGAISQLGDIENGRIFQAKGQSYTLEELIGGDKEIARPFQGGRFATVYLSPKDYHRVHMPLTGKLKSMTYVPGDLFSVNATTAENVPRLFSRNERAVCIFETDAGPMAVILVGAMIVAGIETVWAGQVAPIKREIRTQKYLAKQKAISLKKGQEMGRFKLGSTAIVLFGPDVMQWREDLKAGSPTTMGELFGHTHSSD